MNLYARSMFGTTTNEAFFESLQEHAEHFESIYKEALVKNHD
jgi:aspartokinase/homoserine dehydrogenase 1